MALEIRCLNVSPTPIGRTPGSLSKAIKQQSVKDSIPYGSTNVVQSFRVILAIYLLHRFFEALWKDAHRLFQAFASRPEGLAGPFICKAIERINVSSILSKNTGCGIGAGVLSLRADGSTG